MSYLGLENDLHPFMESTHRMLLQATPPPRETLNSLCILRENTTVTKKCDSDVLVSFRRSLRDSGRELLKRTNLLVQFLCHRSPICRAQRRMVTIVLTAVLVNRRPSTTAFCGASPSRSRIPSLSTLPTTSPPLAAHARRWR